jgi:glycosyltransferase involved in cell wall biosynthesis
VIRPCLALADEIVVPSHYLAEIFDEAGYAARVITNFIRVSDFPDRQREPVQPRLVSTRNLEPYYGVSTVVKAFALVKAEYPQATLTVVGSGREDARLRRLASSLGVGDITFVGQVAPARIPAILSTADIFLNASVVDNQPLSILEAFASGLCVVTTSTGAIAEMVRDGRTAALVRSNDPQAMADAVCELLSDPAKAAAMRGRASLEVEKYSWASIRALWAGVYGCRPLDRAEAPVERRTAPAGATTPVRQ